MSIETRGPGSEACESVREVLPLRAGSYPQVDAAAHDAVSRHLAACPECAGEYAFLLRLQAARPVPPPGLGLRIVARALREAPAESGVIPISTAARRKNQPARWWTSPAAAAAVVVLALGAGLVSQGMQGEQDPGIVALLGAATDSWLGEDWFVAGAPLFDGVSDEALALLAMELEP